MAKQNYRIAIPKEPKEYQTLIKNIDKENDALGAPPPAAAAAAPGSHSPLHQKTEEIKQAVKDMSEAVKLDNEANELDRQAEELREQRDILWKKTTLANERGWRKTLEGEYIKNIHNSLNNGG